MLDVTKSPNIIDIKYHTCLRPFVSFIENEKKKPTAHIDFEYCTSLYYPQRDVLKLHKSVVYKVS